MKRLASLLLLLLSACAPSGPAPERTGTSLPPPELTQQLRTLPGAIVSDGSLPTISYPEQSLFAPAAVMPQVGSEALLDPLVEMLRSRNDRHWQATVRAVSAYGGEYDQRLAAGRARLLERYFIARGLAPGQVTFTAVGEAGTPFELRLLPVQSPSPASSSGEKE
ncbi:hypothetical protein C2E25_00865 [Geothermobacter hydrogeniphilus]|uniref:OmpA family protein n=1 Tax=Geothermobacter hydrogeniphilus TaxID=1969733 RepID=A0A2K2HET5_9BACT|nr:hypothetical protein [Geothermobacter hydrogeniphilus]PNU21812.1 hypothetical protein C2E25_00865 [Geothermobacter hydrogeniphilus]